MSAKACRARDGSRALKSRLAARPNRRRRTMRRRRLRRRSLGPRWSLLQPTQVTLALQLAGRCLCVSEVALVCSVGSFQTVHRRVVGTKARKSSKKATPKAKPKAKPKQKAKGGSQSEAGDEGTSSSRPVRCDHCLGRGCNGLMVLGAVGERWSGDRGARCRHNRRRGCKCDACQYGKDSPCHEPCDNAG